MKLKTLIGGIKKKKIFKEKRRKVDQIKVGFVVQMPEIWDKEAPLFEAMLSDKRFDAYLIIVPHYDLANSRLDQYGEERAYFVEKYPMSQIVLMNDLDDMVIDDSYDYIFYQRCWEIYIPDQLRCKNVINHAITCYIPYCYHGAPEPMSYYRTDFFRYLCKFYCCSVDQYEQVKNIDRLSCDYLGYPVIDSVKYEPNAHSTINILWTPRWTDSPEVGGTSFNRNRDAILSISELYSNVKLVLRPHPLTFENAIKQGWMTEPEIEEYKKRVITSGASFDKNKIIEDTFVDTDILITDFSSSIITYFLSGRPIIYCADYNFVMIDTFRDIIQSTYIARNWNETLKILNDLINGHDPKYDERRKIIEKIKKTGSSVDDIMRDLYNTIVE